jgi:uncharacterized pyridoxamine 5'-phosphate oxidase family protein
MDVKQAKEIMWKKLGDFKIMALASTVNDYPMIRNVSCIFYNDRIYFKTDKNFRKTQQLFENNKVAMCFHGVSLEGIAKNTGLVIDEPGRIFEKKYQLQRITKEAGTWQAPIERPSKTVSFKAFVDSYSVEATWFAGDIVMMSGDSFINPEQTIKIGALGAVRLEELTRKPIYRNKINDLRNANYEIYKQKNVQKQSVPVDEGRESKASDNLNKEENSKK